MILVEAGKAVRAHLKVMFQTHVRTHANRYQRYQRCKRICEK